MSDQLLQILLVEDNPGDALLVQEMLLDTEGDSFEVHLAATLLEALDQVAQHEVDVIVLDLNLPDSMGLETFTSMKTHAPGTPVVLLTGHDDDGLALKAVEAGAQDYLVKDRLEGEALVRALRYAVVRQHSRSSPETLEDGSVKGVLIGALGVKGGVGTTTVACHLAHHLASVSGKRVLLADLDLDGGSAGFLMQAKCPYTILDAAEQVHRLDSGFWESIVSKNGDGVDVISSPALLGQIEPPAPARFRHLLRSAARTYDYVVADLGRLDSLARMLAPDMDHLFLITTSGLAAVHATGRLVESLRDLGVEEAGVTLIQNQAARWSSGTSVLKAVVSLEIGATLPACENELNDAMAKGRLLGESAAFGKQIAKLARGFSGTDDLPQEVSSFSLKRLGLFTGREMPAANH